MSCDEIVVVSFLTELFDQGLGYSGLNTARSALSTILYNEQGLSIGSYPSVKRFLKGVFELRPPSPRYSYIWDVDIVLKYLKNFHPNQDMPLSYLTVKLVMLLSLVTAQRVQTLHKIYVNDVLIYENKAIVIVGDVLKHSNPKNMKVSFELNKYDKCPKICVFSALCEYIKRTRPLRKANQLFISYNKPHNHVSKSTISRWVKRVLEEAGVDVEIFKPHSTRAAACSRLKRDGVSLTEILTTAGWSNSRTFEKFYDKVIIADKSC